MKKPIDPVNTSIIVAIINDAELEKESLKARLISLGDRISRMKKVLGLMEYRNGQ